MRYPASGGHGSAQAALILHGQTVRLSSGATPHRVARNLNRKKGLAVIAGAVKIISDLIELPVVSVFITRGISVAERTSPFHVDAEARTFFNHDPGTIVVTHRYTVGPTRAVPAARVAGIDHTVSGSSAPGSRVEFLRRRSVHGRVVELPPERAFTTSSREVSLI